MARVDIVERRLEQVEQVANLFELAARVGVELAIAGKQMEILQQRDRHAGRNFLGDVGSFDFFAHLGPQ